MTTEIGEIELRIPRDRRGSFEPTVVPKYQRRLDGLAGNVISLYAKGLTTGDIQQHLLEIYGTEVGNRPVHVAIGVKSKKLTLPGLRECSGMTPERCSEFRP